MATKVPFDALVRGIAGAVIEAQDQISMHQLAALERNYFDLASRPRMLKFTVPSLVDGRSLPPASKGTEAAPTPASAQPEDTYEVPFLSLVPATTLRIKDVEITFDVDLVDVTEEPARATEGASPAVAPPARQATQVDLAPGLLKRRGGPVHVVMRIESAEPEGAARLVDHLVKVQGVTGRSTPSK